MMIRDQVCPVLMANYSSVPSPPSDMVMFVRQQDTSYSSCRRFSKLRYFMKSVCANAARLSGSR